LCWLAVVLLGLSPAKALILTGTGNKPVSDPGWPPGAASAANFESRIAWWEGPPFGGGEWHFEYRGGKAGFQECLDRFAKISAPALELFIHAGTQKSFVLSLNQETKADTNTVDWGFTVWVRANWENLYGPGKQVFASGDPNAGKSMPPPRMDFYAGSGIPIAEISVPANVTLHDERAATAGVDTSSGPVVVAAIHDVTTHQPIPGARIILLGRDETTGMWKRRRIMPRYPSTHTRSTMYRSRALRASPAQ
jgi:hypothetical protein